MRVLVSASMKHYDEAVKLGLELKKLGIEADLPKAHDETSTKLDYIKAHMDNLKTADALLVANFNDSRGDGYIGASCFFEIGWAYALGKPIFLLFPPDKKALFTEDIEAIGCTVLNNRLEAMK